MEAGRRAEEALAEVIADLAAKPSRERRRNGWTTDVRREWLAFFEQIQRGIGRGEVPHPRELPTGPQALKGMDAQGVNVMSADDLVDRVIDACGLLRRYADEVARAARSRGS